MAIPVVDLTTKYDILQALRLPLDQKRSLITSITVSRCLDVETAR